MSFAHDTFSSLRIPAYRYFFAGNVASLLGFWIRIVVQQWLVWDLTHSFAMLGVLAPVSLLPFALFSLVGGVMADRLNRRLLLLVVPLISVAANVVIGVLVVAGSIEIWHLFVAAAVVGCARGFEIPVRNALVRDLVGLDNLQNAVAINAASFQVARLAGPALGAALLPFVGIGPCFFVAAAMNALMPLALMAVGPVRSTSSPPTLGPLRQLVEAARYVHGHRRTRTLISLLMVTLLTAWAYQSLMAAYAEVQLGLGESGFALLVATIGLGALAGALWVAGRARKQGSRRSEVFGLLWGGAVCIYFLGLVEHVALAVPLLLVAGFCQVGFFATANGLVQLSVPDAMRGRVMGLWAFTFGTFFPLGSFLMGAVSETWGLIAAYSGGAVLMLAGTIALRLRLPRSSVTEAEDEAERAAAAALQAAEGPG